MKRKSQNPERRNLISQAMEDYLKSIYLLSGASSRVTTTQLAARMKCSPASVTNMLQKLDQLKLVEYRPYQGVILTVAGARVALEVIRHHRLLELYLSEMLGFSWDEVHDQADELEHFISEELEARIDQVLGYPTVDPHGEPIPTKDGRIEGRDLVSLWGSPEDQTARVHLVTDSDPADLRCLASLGVMPGVEVKVLKRVDAEGTVQIEVEGQGASLPERLARQIFVSCSKTEVFVQR